jgi:hypothetical protein
MEDSESNHKNSEKMNPTVSHSRRSSASFSNQNVPYKTLQSFEGSTLAGEEIEVVRNNTNDYRNDQTLSSMIGSNYTYDEVSESRLMSYLSDECKEFYNSNDLLELVQDNLASVIYFAEDEGSGQHVEIDIEEFLRQEGRKRPRVDGSDDKADDDDVHQAATSLSPFSARDSGFFSCLPTIRGPLKMFHRISDRRRSLLLLRRNALLKKTSSSSYHRMK